MAFGVWQNAAATRTTYKFGSTSRNACCASAMLYSSGPLPPMNLTRLLLRMTSRSGSAPNASEAAFVIVSTTRGSAILRGIELLQLAAENRRCIATFVLGRVLPD